ncbi:MAG: hypothetical protein Q9180_000935 [Flavoplaca navasiana]
MDLGQLLREHLGAKPLNEHYVYGVYHASLIKFRDLSYCDQDPNLRGAVEILAYIKRRYLQYLSADPGSGLKEVVEEPTDSDNDPGSQASRQRLADMDPRYGPAIDNECEVILHHFPQDGPVSRNPTEEPSLLWVRPEYIRIWQYLNISQSRPVIVTGQPGIGKTRLLQYLLIKRIRDDKPVLVQFPGTGLLILYHASRIYHIPVDKDQYTPYEALQAPFFTKYLGDLWVLLDASDYMQGIPRWSFHIPGAKLVYATSPDHTRWKTLVGESFYPRIVVMNPYTRSEALLLAILEAEARPLKVPSDLPRDPETKSRLCKTAMKFWLHSPGPRFFIVYAWSTNDPEKELRRLEGETESTVMTTQDDSLRNLFDFKTNAVSRNLSHSIVCVERHPDNNGYYRTDGESTRARLALLNNKVLSVLTERLEKLSQDTRRTFFDLVSSNPDTRFLAGNMFQGQLWRLWVEVGIHLKLHKAEGGSNSQSIVYRSTSDFEQLDISVDRDACDYNLPEIIENNVLCYPANPRFPGIDFLIRDHKTARILRDSGNARGYASDNGEFTPEVGKESNH